MLDRLNAILGRDLRANPDYELVLFDRLEPGQRELVAGLAQEADFYGVLRPRAAVPAGALGVKAVCRETALLYLTLRQPGPLPDYVRAVHGGGTARLVAQLVADGVLQVDTGDGFASGPGALAPLTGGGPPGSGCLAELSLAALRHGAALALDDPLLLSLRLYAFNRLPLTPAWKRRLADAAAVERLLGIAPGGRCRGLLTRAYAPRGESGGWLSYRLLAPGSGAGPVTAAALTYKLYLSPLPERMGEAFCEILAALAAARVPHFKVGAGAAGLLRPDKLVAYFTSFEALAEAAAGLAPRLAGLPAHGVPFTAEIGAESGGGGLLSWGVDPPRRAPAPQAPWNGAESWRLRLTHRLARALLAARAAEAHEAWRFALERLRLEGVDTATWTPDAGWFQDL
jgi:hypothetical protein